MYHRSNPYFSFSFQWLRPASRWSATRSASASTSARTRSSSSAARWPTQNQRPTSYGTGTTLSSYQVCEFLMQMVFDEMFLVCLCCVCVLRGRGITQKRITQKSSFPQNRNLSERKDSERKDSERKDSERLLALTGITQKGKTQKDF
jgi:hypothetical protein